MTMFHLQFLKISILFCFCSAQISDKRLCADPECNSPVSLAKTLRRYYSPDQYRLSFGPNEDVVIFSKSAGSDENLWGAEINGKRGYIPKNLVRETKMMKQANLLVNTEIENSLNEPKVQLLKEEVLYPSKVKKKFEVIDGTTLYMEKQTEYKEASKSEMETISDPSNVSNVNSVKIVEEAIINDNLTDSASLEGIKDSEQIVADILNQKGEEETIKLQKNEDIITDNLVIDKREENKNIDTLDIEINNKTENDTELNVSTKDDAGENGSGIFEDLLQNSDVSNNSIDSSTSVDRIEENTETVMDYNLNISNSFEIVEKSEPVHENNLIVEKNEIERNNFIEEENISEFLSTVKDIDNSVTPIPIIEHSKEEENISEFLSTVKDIDNSVTPTPIIEHSVEEENISEFLPTVKDIENSVTPIIELQENNILTLEETQSSNEISTNETSDSSKTDNYSKIEVFSENFETELGSEKISNNFEFGTKEEKPENNDNLISERSEIETNLSQENDKLKEQNSDSKFSKNSNDFLSKPDVLESNILLDDHLKSDGLLGSDQNLDTLENDNIRNENDHLVHNTFSYSTQNIINLSQDNERLKVQNPNIPSDETVETQSTSEESREIFINSESTMKDNILNKKSKSFDEFPEKDADDFCSMESCPDQSIPEETTFLWHLSMDMPNFKSDIFLYLVTTAVSVVIFLLGHFALDKSRREGPLITKINKLEKEFLILLREKELLVEQMENKTHQIDDVKKEDFTNLMEENENLKDRVQFLEEQVQTLEKELENSTEVGLELNRMLSEVLSSENAGQTLMLNIEGLQAQLTEQQNIVTNMKEILSVKETENHEITLELDIANKKVIDLQSEVDKLLLKIIKLEEDKENVEKSYELRIIELETMLVSSKKDLQDKETKSNEEIENLKSQLSAAEHNLQLKNREYEGLKNSIEQMKFKDADNLESLLDLNSVKAELDQLKSECLRHCEKLRREKETNCLLQEKIASAEEETRNIRSKFDETDKKNTELETKLQVLTNYFKDKEEQLQKELSKYENLWSAKQGEATSTSERIKYLQDEVQNYKSQNETLRQEIVFQEVDLKGQISVLEKKVHENWVSARQAERRLEELKQEAAQLRNRLTLRERAAQENRLQNRIHSPLEHTEEIPISHLHMESPASPPPLYNSREHITKSPPLLGMPFLPPPSGGPFLPPPPLPFMPPPPHDMFPGDHRPPPLGRMSSPPLNARYSPFDRSPSPSYDESEYGTSPVHRRNYPQFTRRRDRRPDDLDKFNGRSILSSGSDNSNESLEEINNRNSKV